MEFFESVEMVNDFACICDEDCPYSTTCYGCDN